MRIGGGGSTNINLLTSDRYQFRNEDFDTNNEASFIGSHYLAASSGNKHAIGIKNNVASTQVCLVDNVIISLDSADYVYIMLTTGNELGGFGQYLQTKKTGGTAAPQTSVSYETAASVPGTQVGTIDVPTTSSVQLSFQWPFIVAADHNFYIITATANIGMAVTFQCRLLVSDQV
jgi:hypothetical protein